MCEQTDEEPQMEKRAVVVIGKTPSVHSGKPCEMIKNGEAILSSEEELNAACNGKCNGKCKQ